MIPDLLCRRALLRSSALVPALALLTRCGAVTQTTTNGVTTVKINVAQIDTWFAALDSGASLVLSLTGVAATPAGLALTAIGATISADLKAFDTATKGQATLTFDTTSVPSFVLALETDANNLLTNVKTAVSGAVATDVTTAQNYLNAVETVVSLFMAEFGSLTVGAAAGAAPKMSEADALAVLTKK